MDMSFDGKSALSQYGLSLVSASITPPVRKRYWVDIPGGDGAVDLYEGLGEPAYENRSLTAVFRPVGEFQQTVERLVNNLEGHTMQITLPNDSQHYMSGCVHIPAAFAPSISSCGEITISATCLPWRYSKAETVYQAPKSENAVQHTLRNAGSRSVVPTVIVEGEAIIEIGTTSSALAAGTYQMTGLRIPGGGSISIKVSGGPVEIRYREAML